MWTLQTEHFNVFEGNTFYDLYYETKTVPKLDVLYVEFFKKEKCLLFYSL